MIKCSIRTECEKGLSRVPAEWVGYSQTSLSCPTFEAGRKRDVQTSDFHYLSDRFELRKRSVREAIGANGMRQHAANLCLREQVRLHGPPATISHDTESCQCQRLNRKPVLSFNGGKPDEVYIAFTYISTCWAQETSSHISSYL